VLVIDLWNVLTASEAADVEALRALYAEYRDSRYVEFVGVNADAESRTADARQFARDHGLDWPQHYEQAGRQSPITHQAFAAGNPPWQVLIDQFGFVRAVGSAREAGFQHALRAAIAEARGDREPVMPRTRDGRQAERPGAVVSIEPKPPAKGKSAGELRSDPEAAAKLRRARAFLKAHRRTDAKQLFEEIVRDHAGTLEAQQAQEYLDSVWGGP
jgi:hypothetical protein